MSQGIKSSPGPQQPLQHDVHHVTPWDAGAGLWHIGPNQQCWGDGKPSAVEDVAISAKEGSDASLVEDSP